MILLGADAIFVRHAHHVLGQRVAGLRFTLPPGEGRRAKRFERCLESFGVIRLQVLRQHKSRQQR